MKRGLILETISLMLGAALLFTLGGCATRMVAKKRVEEKFPSTSRVAVIPFENLSGTEKAAEKITDYFQTIMKGIKKFETVEYGETYDLLRQFRVRSSTQITEAQIDTLTSRLNLDFILTGAVLEFEEYDNSYLGRIPQVSLNCRMIDCRSKKTVWVATNNGRGDRGEVAFGIGAIKSSEALARQMVEEAVQDLTALFD